MMMIRLVLTATLTCVSAQNCWSQASPANVNDCTLIQEPTELRNCILRSQGERQSLPTTIESSTPSTPPAPAGDGDKAQPATSKLGAAADAAEKKRLRLLKKQAIPVGESSGSAGRPRPPVSEVWVDQIALPGKR